MSHSESVSNTPTSKGVLLTFALIAVAVVLLALAFKIWGLVALTMAALPLVPVMFIIFVWISLP